MNQPKITIIIPTRERADVLGPALRTVTAQDYDRLEILVSDNFSSDNTRDVVESARDSRIRYINTGKRLSMSHNWEFALSHVSEGWVSFLGDDDGLMPDALSKLSALIAETKALAVRSSLCNYVWPGVGRDGQSRLSVPLRTGFEIRHSEEWLVRVLKGKSWYTDLPVIYHAGYVDYSVVEKIKRMSGRFFRSSIPDVYSGMAIASTVEGYVYSHEPLGINGASPHSQGRSAVAANLAASSPAEKFMSEDNIPFHVDVPLAPGGVHPKAVTPVVFEAYLQSLLLRPDVRRLSSYAEQLRLALKTAPDINAVEEWASLFASRHGLDIDVFRRRAVLERSARRVLHAFARIPEELKIARVWKMPPGPDDVFHASRCAGALLVNKPSIGERGRRLSERVIERLVRKHHGLAQ